jgi:hypothetical protein
MNSETPNPVSRFDYLPIAIFLCVQHKVSDVRFINPFPNMVHAHTIPRKTVLGVNHTAYITDPKQGVTCLLEQSTWKGPALPKDPFLHPVTGMAMDHDVNEKGVCIFNITCRHYRMDALEDAVVAVRLNFYNKHTAELQDTKKIDQIFEAAGSVKGGFAYLTPSMGKDINEIPMPQVPFGYQNEHFTKTFMLVDETNLMNGIITIPHEVCVAARLPVWKGAPPLPDERMLSNILESLRITDPVKKEEQRIQFIQKYQNDFMEAHKDDKKSTFFYAVPRKHVLAWAYASEAYMAQFDFKVEYFRFVHADTKKSKLLYYLVPNAPFEDSLKFFKESFLGKIDRHPLKDIGFEFVPVKLPPRSSAAIEFRSYFTYYSVPYLNPQTIKCLAPTLCKGFPLCHNWSEDEMSMQYAADKLVAERKSPQKFTNKT